MKIKYIIYSNIDEVQIMTEDQEESFKQKAKEWKMNLDPNDGDYDRLEIESDCGIQVESKKGFLFD